MTRQLIILAIGVVLISTSFCGGKKTESRTDQTPAKAVSRLTDNAKNLQQPKKDNLLKSAENRDKILDIQEIRIEPESPVTGSTILVKAVVSASEEEQQVIEIMYVFWVNAEKIREGSEPVLESHLFKKGDFIYVDVTVQKNGREILRRRSEMIQILNTSPEITNVEFPDIAGPGTYEIKVTARDIDKDQLTYSLDGEKLPEGLGIDSSTGVVTLELQNDPPEKLTFYVVVRDDAEGETKQEVTLTFQKAKPKEGE